MEGAERIWGEEDADGKRCDGRGEGASRLVAANLAISPITIYCYEEQIVVTVYQLLQNIIDLKL